jgi:alkanesulfonate monooxygenase SsuD/methylene tetrahydromethanopterin reductase-like flavin-dependent oxidoreductase (luciferase family)
MKIGVGLPASMPKVAGEHVLDWARQAEAGPFASLGLIDRLVYDNYEPLITLATVAGVTKRVRLVTTVLLTPLHNAGILAKQCASLDALSGGRLTLGLGIGVREADFIAAPADYQTRGERFDEQLELMTRVWSGQPVSKDVGRIGPEPVQPGGPEVLGGFTAATMYHLKRWGHGYMAGHTPPEQVKQLYQLAKETWEGAGRPGTPRFVSCIYYGLGPRAAQGVASYIGEFYAHKGTAQVQQMIQDVAVTPESLRTTIQQFADIGTDELILWPCTPELDQLHRLADVVDSLSLSPASR